VRVAPRWEQRGPALGARRPPSSLSRARHLSLPSHATFYTDCPWRCRRAHKLRQVRPFHGPEETLRAPATGLQDIGFLAHEAKAEKRRIKNHCAETKFKSELIKAGIYV
jgi:hypothetical protein